MTLLDPVNSYAVQVMRVYRLVTRERMHMTVSTPRAHALLKCKQGFSFSQLHLSKTHKLFL